MPIDVSDSLRKTSHYVFSSSILGSLLGSPIPLALTVSLILVIIIMLIYPAKTGTGFGVICKIFIYSFLINMALFYLHDGILRYTIDEKYRKNDDDTFGGSDELAILEHFERNNNLQPVSTIQHANTMQPTNAMQPTNTIQPVINKPLVSIVEGGSDTLNGMRPHPRQPNMFQ